jgi:hypothetical protein
MLLKSCRQGEVEEVRTLLVRGESVNQKDYWGASAIHCAVDLKPPLDLKMLQVLLSDEHIDLNAQEGLHKRTAAHLCASKGKADCLAALIQVESCVGVVAAAVVCFVLLFCFVLFFFFF